MIQKRNATMSEPTDTSVRVSEKNGLYCFSHDLRLQDNAILNELIDRCDRILFVYIIDRAWFTSGRAGGQKPGHQRWRFLSESLQSLDSRLQRYGHQLHLLIGDPLTLLPDLCQQQKIQIVASSYNSGFNEYSLWQKLRNISDCTVLSDHLNTLFTQQQLPVGLPELPRQFTPFKQKVQSLNVHKPVRLNERLSQIRSASEPDNTISLNQLPIPVSSHGHAPFTGGEDAGWQQLHHYLWVSRQIEQYKHTRNELDGWQNASRLSPWLALGCLSARQIMADLERYESEVCANESTAFLKFELLWREFFYWSAHRLQSDLYRPGGERRTNLLTSFYPQRFRSWCEGSTPYPLVNACMKELNHTGFLSNRGRQIAASALVNELAVSWHYGAAYFESQLIDYDPGSNYGNWQYIAGVGADPRGGRHFNIERQRKQFDPDNRYIQHWRGNSGIIPEYTGIDDWPIA